MSFSGNALYIPKHLALQTQIAVPSIVHLVGHSVSNQAHNFSNGNAFGNLITYQNGNSSHMCIFFANV